MVHAFVGESIGIEPFHGGADLESLLLTTTPERGLQAILKIRFSSKRCVELRKFLDTIDANVPRDLEVL